MAALNTGVVFTPYKIEIDYTGLYIEIGRYVRLALGEVEKEYLKQMADEIDKSSHSPERFHKAVKAGLKHIEMQIVDSVMTLVCGFDVAGSSLGDTIKARVVNTGMGNKADGGGRAVYAGPKGRAVWDRGLNVQFPSNQFFHRLPDSWNHPGEHFVENATKLMEPLANDIAQAVFDAAIPKDILHRHVTVTKA